MGQCRVIAIGASAGGLEGLLALLPGLSQASVAVVIAQHMARDEHTQLVLSLLRREGCWPVVIPSGHTILEAGVIYLLPAEQDGLFVDNALQLAPPSAESYSSPSVDILFRSLAQTYRNQAVGIMLSGAGSDGANGARAIHRAGGQLWVQSPDEACYDSMPLSVLNAVPSAHVAPVLEIRAQLLRAFTTNPVQQPERPVAADVDFDLSAQAELAQLVVLLEQATGVAFAGYKSETLLRRIDKRKAQLGLLEPGQYIEYFKQHSHEAHCLEQFLLVSVSDFFRDPEVFHQLKHRLISSPALRFTSPFALPFRVLVAGCATGEEAYSLAILFRQPELNLNVDIIAVDLNQDAIQTAKAGRYPLHKLSALPKNWLSEYFNVEGDQAEVKDELRQQIQFIQADLFRLALEGRFQLICCRNLMIYLKVEQQEQLLERFHQVMSEGAWLVTGLMESLSPVGHQLFKTEDHFHRIFRYRPALITG